MDYATLQRAMDTANERLLAVYKADPDQTLHDVLFGSRICDTNKDANELDTISTLICTEYERLKLQARFFDVKDARSLDHQLKTDEQALFNLYQQSAADVHRKALRAKACLADEAHRLAAELIDQGVRRLRVRDFEVQGLEQWLSWHYPAWDER
jgi:hypothetical protein